VRRLVYLGIGVIALLGATLAMGYDPIEPVPAPAAPAVASLAEADLRNELRELRRQVAAVGARVSDEAPADDTEIEAAPKPAPSSEETAARFEHALAATIASEGDDPSWSRATEARIASALRSDAFAGTQLRAARCQRTLCRIELAHVDPDAQDNFLARVTHTPPFNTRGYIKPSLPGDPAATEVYVARDGAPLPTVN
jgi:hypothetical protein